MAELTIRPSQISANNTTAGQVLSSDGTKTVWTSTVGYTGSAGTTGYTGSAGTAGSIGYTGSAGPQGEIGYTGSAGSQGSIGYTGSTGSQGSIGYTGSASTVPGYTGSQGYTGSAGSAGSIGYTGSQGYTGSAGVGYTGSASAGYTGSIGYTGSQGEIGYTGSAGASSTANATSQSFTGNGSNTAFTLAASIANSNNAVVTLDGLVQIPTTHYSISSTTLTFTTAPVDGTVIEVRNLENGAGGGGGGGGGASVTISDTAPVSPTAGSVWWNSNTGYAFIYYDDGTSSQWVELSPRANPQDVTEQSMILNLTLGLL